MTDGRTNKPAAQGGLALRPRHSGARGGSEDGRAGRRLPRRPSEELNKLNIVTYKQLEQTCGLKLSNGKQGRSNNDETGQLNDH